MQTKHLNQLRMGPCSRGAFIEISVVRSNWKDALTGLEMMTKQVKEELKNVKTDYLEHPEKLWKKEQERLKMIKREKRLASKT